MAGRRANGDGSIFPLPNGKWRAVVELGVANGQRQRKAVTRPTRREASAWLREAIRAKEAGGLVSRTPTVAE
jgi:integrase